MKILCSVFLMVMLSGTVLSQNDEVRVRQYLKDRFPSFGLSAKILFDQCKYKAGKNWQYVIACSVYKNNQNTSMLIFAEKVHDTILKIEPFYFGGVEHFDHINMDKSRDGIEELYITTTKDSGNLEEKYTGIYSLKDGFVDTLIKFYSYAYKTLRAPWFVYQPGIIIEQEDICKLTDINGDGKTEVANRIHRKILNKDPYTNNNTFLSETDYSEYKLDKGKFVKINSNKAAGKEEFE